MAITQYYQWQSHWNWVAAAKGKKQQLNSSAKMQSNNSGVAGIAGLEENQLDFLTQKKYNTVRQT